MDRTATLVPAFAVKDLPLGRTLDDGDAQNWEELKLLERSCFSINVKIRRKNNTNKCNEFRNISLNRCLRYKMEEKLEEQFGFWKGKETRDAIGLIRIIGERYVEKHKDVYAVFVDLEKAFVRMD